jgi:predicted RNA-binding Zn-ribbon protein involved in translation (DUF1610 family)
MSDSPYIADRDEMECDRELERGDDKDRCHACDAVLVPEEQDGEEPERCPSCGEVL